MQYLYSRPSDHADRYRHVMATRYDYIMFESAVYFQKQYVYIYMVHSLVYIPSNYGFDWFNVFLIDQI